MREALFIKKNKDRWLRIQQTPSADPDEMASDFTQLVNDLAYAKTFYPAGKVTQYINSQASKVFLDIYRNKKEESNRIVHYWKYDLPLTIRKHHRVALFSFAIFLIFFSIGFFTSMQDEEIVRSILGDSYVDMTQENIARGNPFGVYEGGTPFYNFMGLMIHNIKVDMLIFVSGIFAGAPSLYIEGNNAIMVGTFDYLFYQHGLGLDFWLVVFVHGTLEMTALILSASAGFILGKSYLFPGTIRRLDSLKQGAKDGVKIMIGLLPVSAMAAFFEAYVTRLYNDAAVITTLVVVLSLLFVIWYFVVYPIRLGRRSRHLINEEEI
ncbi:MAG: stage II sporulation protein M [Chitinophagaceae bacterium]|nr:stage II sporulation protein M [Chitinophagaceae bacterium]